MEGGAKIKGPLKQIFLYLTLQCNAKCIACYMRRHYSMPRELSFAKAKYLLRKYHSWGARKLTLLGGEPTLYPHLEKLVKFAKDIGYSYVRIQTNGQFNPEILLNPLIQENVDTFSFSIDGHTEDLNRRIRKGCSLRKTVKNMRLANQMGYDVRVNITVTSINMDYLFDIIEVAENNGASVVYLNIVFPKGAAINHPYLVLSPERWIDIFNKIKRNSHKFKVKLKVPVGYGPPNLANHQCIAFKMSRLYVMPNGDAYPCVLFIDQPKLRVDEYPYTAKLTAYANASYEEMNKYCHFLPHIGGKPYIKPLCLYYRKIWGDTQF